MAQPNEQDLQQYYRQHLDMFMSEGIMALADYVLPRGADPAIVAADSMALRAGHTPQGLTRTEKMADGEEFYFAARIHLGDRLFSAARALKAGEVSQPIVLPDGTHLLVMQKNVVPVAPPYSDVRDKVLAAYVTAQSALLTSANERFLRKRADIQIAQGYE